MNGAALEVNGHGGAFPYIGGKNSNAKHIIPYLPMLGTYVEPFAGSLAVLLRRPPAISELVNDLDGRIVNLWRAWRDCPNEWLRKLEYSPHSRVEHYRSSKVVASANLIDDKVDIDLALATYISLEQAVGRIDGYWAWGQANAPRARDWPTMAGHARIMRIANRLRKVELECLDAIKVIARYDDQTMIYCDPPYVRSSRLSAGKQYLNEPDDDWHRDFLSACIEAPSNIAISGYPSDLYDDVLHSWKSITFSSTIHSQHATPGASKPKREEVLWMNYDYRDFESTAQAKLWGED